jgi:hypothetical protein
MQRPRWFCFPTRRPAAAIHLAGANCRYLVNNAFCCQSGQRSVGFGEILGVSTWLKI